VAVSPPTMRHRKTGIALSPRCSKASLHPIRLVIRNRASSMPDEADRVREAYARRDRLGLEARYDYWRPDNLFTYQARERAVLDLLDAASLLPLTGRRVLDVGCGDGAVLAEMLRHGATPNALYGVDL